MKFRILIFSILICAGCFGQQRMFHLQNQPVAVTGCVDPDGQRVIDSVGASGADAIAICTLIKMYKDSGLWAKRDVINPFFGSTAATQAFNFKDPATFKLAFVGSWTHSASGADPAAASTAYATTGYIPSSSGSMTTSSASIAIDIVENYAGAGADNYDIGAFNSVTQAMLLTATGNGTTTATRNLSENITNPGVVTTIGLWTSSHTTSTNTDFYYNAINIGSGTSSNGSLPTYQIYLGNINLTGGTYSSSAAGRKMDFIAIGQGLTAAEVATEYNILSIFKTAIGR